MRVERNASREREQGNEFINLLMPPALDCDRGTEDGAQGICPFVAGQSNFRLKLNI